MDTTKVIKQILTREGGFVDHPVDKGGPTNMGITLKTLSDWRKPSPVGLPELRSLSVDDAIAIYTKLYVDPVLPFASSQELLDLLVDSSVLHGVSRTKGWITDIQKFSTDTNVLYKGILKRRFQLIADIVANNPQQVVFLRGWINRLSEFIR